MSNTMNSLQHSISILIIEDNLPTQQSLHTVLSQAGYETLLAHDSVTARNFLAKKSPDLVLLDLMLPDISGETLCQEIKMHHPHTQVIMLTAKDMTHHIVEGLSLGA